MTKKSKKTKKSKRLDGYKVVFNNMKKPYSVVCLTEDNEIKDVKFIPGRNKIALEDFEAIKDHWYYEALTGENKLTEEDSDFDI